MTRGKRGGLQLQPRVFDFECSQFYFSEVFFFFFESESLAFSSVAFCVVAELRVEH